MAKSLTFGQVAQLTAAIRGVAEAKEPSDMLAFAAALRGLDGMSEEEVANVEAGVALLSRSPEDRPAWVASKGRGLFFAFEGLHRGGEPTASRAFARHLQTVLGESAVKWLSFPRRSTAIGFLLDLYLRREVELPAGTATLLLSANRWEAAEEIVWELNRGVTVVCERFSVTGVAYAVAGGRDFAECQALDAGLPRPDGVFVVNMEQDAGSTQVDDGFERYSDPALRKRVLAEFLSPRLCRSAPWFEVDARRGSAWIQRVVRERAASLALDDWEADLKPIRRLWA